MIDFNTGTEKLNKYPGSEKKITVLYRNELYMIKFPDPIRDQKNTLSYINNQFSEHIGSQIFKACGIAAQETCLGFYTDKKGTRKVVVGCKDFTQDGSVLYECSKLGNAIVEVDEKLGNSVESVHLIIQSTAEIRNKDKVKDKFWDMFVIDALLGNYNRHLGSWGVWEKNGEVSFAPIYGCSSTLGALLDDEKMRSLLDNPTEFRNQEYNTKSCYRMNGKKIFYHEIFGNPPKELAEAIKRIIPKIDIDTIHQIVATIECMSDIRKEYLIKALDLRYSQILAPALR